MSNFLDMDTNSIVISEFYENHTLKKYNYEAGYQREYVWNLEKKRFLIDSILKNFPIPPIFLRMYIEEDTGKTKYDVIDGKQRLNTILEFIDGKINVPNDFDSEPFGNENLNGVYFNELDKIGDYKKRFWRYKIPIIYVDSKEEDVIRSVFDRLNRNGEPLTFQELRKAKYYETDFYKVLEKLSQNFFWHNKLKDLEINRMEDKEFLSELLFVILEKGIMNYTKEDLDKLYEEWIKKEIDYKEITDIFEEVTTFMNDLSLDYDLHKITGVSHLYGIWCLSYICFANEINANEIRTEINNFFTKLREKSKVSNHYITEYRQSMSSGTKSKSSRMKRVNALIGYLKESNYKLKEKFQKIF